MANFNRVILLGRLTRDPQLRYTPSQMAVCDFGLAISRQWKAQDGQKREEVTFVDCTAWGRQAETIQKYTAKGRPLFVEGRLTFRQWDGPDGKKRSKLEVTVENFQFVDSGKGGSGGGGGSGGSGGGGGGGGRSGPAPGQDAQHQQAAGEQEQAAPDYDFNQDVDDDTIPF